MSAPDVDMSTGLPADDAMMGELDILIASNKLGITGSTARIAREVAKALDIESSMSVPFLGIDIAPMVKKHDHKMLA